MHEIIGAPEIADQVQGLGPAGQHRLGALVHRQPADLADLELAADARGALQDGHARAAAREQARRRQARDARPDDHDMGGAHASNDPRYLPRTRQHPRPARPRPPGVIWARPLRGLIAIRPRER
nr:hypothetical protein GCM10010200_010640 [Actinomadura rugatobispora]